MRAVDAIVLASMAEGLAGPKPGEHVQRLVEHRRVHLRVDGLAERTELLVGREAEPDTEDGFAAGHVVERRDLLRHDLRSSSREWRDDRAQVQALRASGARAEHDPWVVHREVEVTTEVEVIPQEEAIPPGGLGELGQLDQRQWVADVGDADREAHRPSLHHLSFRRRR